MLLQYRLSRLFGVWVMFNVSGIVHPSFARPWGSKVTWKKAATINEF